MPRRRKQQPQSGPQQILGALSKALPSAAAAKKAKPSSGKGKGGLALLGLAGAAAFMKKSGKGPFSSGKGEEVVVEPATVPPAATVPPTPEAADLSSGVRPAI